jgi:hypothetical protein
VNLQKYGSVRKAVDFTSLNNVPLLYFGIATHSGSLHSIFYENVHQDLSLLNIFLIAVYFFLIFISIYFFKTDPLGLKPFFLFLYLMIFKQ